MSLWHQQSAHGSLLKISADAMRWWVPKPKRRDDMLACKNIRCRKRFEIEGLQSIALLQEAPSAPAEDRSDRIRAAFGRRV